MNIGKEKCRILKEIRRKLAEANDIKLDIEECKHKGNCSGSCPRCEYEILYLERKLYQRQMLGKAIVMAGLTFNIGMFSPTPMIAAEPNDVTVNATDSNKVGKYQIKGIVRDDVDCLMSCDVTVRDEKNKIKYYAQTNEKGEFCLAVDELPVNIRFSFVGYYDECILVTSENYQKPLDVTLKGSFLMGEVVIKKAKKTKKEKKAKKQKYSTEQNELPQNLHRLPLTIETQEEIKSLK